MGSGLPRIVAAPLRQSPDRGRRADCRYAAATIGSAPGEGKIVATPSRQSGSHLVVAELAFAGDLAEIGIMEREVLTAEEAAEFLRVDRKTVYEYVARRKIPHQRLGRRIILSRSALLAWIAAGPGMPTVQVRSAPAPSEVSQPVREHRRPAPVVNMEPPLPPQGPYPTRSWKDPVSRRYGHAPPRTSAEKAELKAQVLAAVLRYPGHGARQYGEHLGEYPREIYPSLAALVAEGRLFKTGQRRTTRYHVPSTRKRA